MFNLKNIILQLGTKFIDIMVLLIFVLLVLAAFIAMTQVGFLYGLLFLVCGSISLIMSTFFIYLFIDMRESLLKIVGAQQNGAEQVAATQEAEKAE